MKYKQYRLYKLLIVVILAAIVSSFVVRENFIIPLVVLLIAVLLMFFLRKNLDEITSDERIDKIVGRASRLTFTIVTLLMAISGMILIALRNKFPEYYLAGNVLAYLTCGMLFLYAILFKYYSRKI